jgi:hypothetical protein
VCKAARHWPLAETWPSAAAAAAALEGQRVLVISSVADIAIAATLAVGGIAMTPLPTVLVAGTLVAAVIFAFILDLIKVPVFSRLGIAGSPRDEKQRG